MFQSDLKKTMLNEEYYWDVYSFFQKYVERRDVSGKHSKGTQKEEYDTYIQIKQKWNTNSLTVQRIPLVSQYSQGIHTSHTHIHTGIHTQ